MAEIKLGKKDVIWSYLAQFLSIGSGVITLPFILNKLSTAEIGLNYILLTVGSVIALVDLGFAPQFARNFTYVFSGAQELKKEGVGVTSNETNYELLAYLLKTARYIYGILAILALVLLLVVGTPYVYKTTDGFLAVPNAQYVWIIYSFGVLFQIFYSYYFSMLLGAGKVKEQKYAIIGNKILYMVILISGLYLGAGLLSVALAQLISPFLGRFIAYRSFYSDELKLSLSNQNTKDRNRIINIFNVLWFNAKRTAVMQIGSYAILRFSMFIAGLYLTLEEFASYGLMVQLVGIIGTASSTFMQISQPKFASLRARHAKENLLASFSIALLVYYILFIIGAILLIIWGDEILLLIKANADFPTGIVMTLYCAVMFFEYNHANFAILISSDNKVPFAPASILTGLAVCIGIFIVVRFTSLGVLGLVIVQGVCQAAYQNWKWPQMALRKENVSLSTLLRIGASTLLHLRYS